MAQFWLRRARTSGAVRARRRGAGAVGWGLVALLGACTAQEGTAAVLANPRPITDRDHRATPAPAQRWGSAAGMPHTLDGPRNTTVPPSLQSKFPPVVAPQLPANKAEVVPAAPPAAPRSSFSAGSSREEPAARTANQRRYINADGTQTTEISAAPLNYRAVDGSWAPIDATLRQVAGGWERTADSVKLRLAQRSDALEVVRAELPGGGVVAYGWADANPVSGVAAGDTARYRGVWTDVDIELQTQAGGVKDTLVLSSARAPRTFVFPLRLTGLTASLLDGAVILVDAAGVRRATIPAGYLIDAAGETSHDAVYGLTTRNGVQALEVRLSDAWVSDPSRKFPVRVDPPIVASGAATEQLVVEESRSRGDSDEMLVGNFGGDRGRTASYLRFPSLETSLRHHTIYGVQMQAVNFDSASCRAREVTVHPVTDGWSPTTSTKYPGPSVGRAIASQSFAQGHVGLGQAASACPVTGSVIDLGVKGRDLVQGWVDDTVDNNGISLRAPVSDTGAWKKFAGTTSQNPPRLFVTHSPYNAKYSVPNPVPEPAVLQNQGGQVKITVTNRSAATWNANGFQLIYRIFDAATQKRVNQFVAAPVTRDVPRGASVTFDARIRPLPIGIYWIDFSMAKVGGPIFTDEGVPPARISLQVDNISPVARQLHPPNGYQSPVLTPQLWAEGLDLDAPAGTTLRYKYEHCKVDGAGKPTGCVQSPYSAAPSYTVPAGAFAWSKTYLWRVFLRDNATEVASDYSTLTTVVPQPAITSKIANAPYGSQERDFDPNLGNVSTGAVDVSISTVGPPLAIARTYNSLDPRRNLAFGAGWMTQIDMRLAFDDDGSGNAVVTYPDGQQVRFGRNPDGSFAAPLGRTAELTIDTAKAVYVLRDRAGSRYEFNNSGRIVRISDRHLNTLFFIYDSATGKLARMRSVLTSDQNFGRSLTFGWTGNHVTSVSTDPVDNGTRTWTYAYDGDLLTKVCAPDRVSCTSYSYASVSHYRSGVLDSAPDSYWRLGEERGATSAGSQLAVNMGKDAAPARDVSFGLPGALGGTSDKAAGFNGTTSMVTLPKGIIKRSRNTSVELWFKINSSQRGGPLLGYQNTAYGGSPTLAGPLLYVGQDGLLRGQFRTTAATPKPIVDVTKDVRDDKWHHVALTVAGDVQRMFLDGRMVGTKPASEGALDQNWLTHSQVGAAHAPAPRSWPGWGDATTRSFEGSIDEVAVYGHALPPQTIAAHHALQAEPADQLTRVSLPSGKVAAEMAYDNATGRVTEYTDGNGGTWKIGAPVVFGNARDLRRSITVSDPANRRHLYEYDALAGRILRTGQPLGASVRDEDKPSSPAPSPSPTRVCTSPDPDYPQFCTTVPGDADDPTFTERELTGIAIRSYSYDDQGRQNEITDETGSKITMTFDDRGNVTSRKTCRDRTTCFTTYTSYALPSPDDPFDLRNDLPVVVRDGRSTGPTDDTFAEKTSYTDKGEVSVTAGPGPGTTRTTYTSVEPAIDAPDRKMPSGLVRTVTDAIGRTTTYGYTVYGDLALVVSATGLRTEYTYDALGRRIRDREVSSDAYPDGVITTYSYDDQNRPVSVTGPVTTNIVDNVRHQIVSTTAYDIDGNVIRQSARDVLGGGPERVTTMDYDEHNRVTRTVDAEGNEQTEGWDRFGNRVSLLDGNGNRYEYAYTARNDLAEVRLYDWTGDPDATRSKYVVLNAYTYDFAGRIAAQIDSMGRRIEYLYYRDDLVQKVVLKDFRDPDGSKRDYVIQENTYDGAGNVIRQATGNGLDVTENTIDTAGRVTRVRQDPGGLNRSTWYQFDSIGNVTQTRRMGSASNVPWPTLATLSNTVVNEYDSAGRLRTERVVGETQARATTYTHDQRGLVTSVTDPRGNVAGADKAAYTTTYRYDESGELIAATAPVVKVENTGGAVQDGRPTVLTGFNGFGEVVATKDALGNVSRTAYDRLGRPVTRTGPLYTSLTGPGAAAAPVVSTKYDALGNPVETTDPRGNVTRYQYDRLNRVIARDEPGAINDERRVWRFTYTRTGQTLSTISPTGIRTENTYDDLDRPVTATRVERKPLTDTFTTTLRYDDAGNLLSMTSPTGAVTRMSYNTAGDLLTTTDPNNVIAQQGYDGLGNTVRVTDGAGRTTRINFDEFGQLASQADLSPAGATLRTERFTYDAAGNAVERISALGKKVSFEYDALNRMTMQVEPKTATSSITTSFGYDAAGNRTRYTDGRRNSTFYDVNSLGLPERVVEPATAAQPGLADRTWTVSYDLNGNATELLAPGASTRVRSFDAANRLVNETGTDAGSTVRRGLTYDLDDRVTAVTAPGNSNTFTYDDRGNLLTAAGGSGTASFAYNGDSQLVSRSDAAGTAKFGYVKSRLETVRDGVTGATQKIGYNTAGLVSSVDYGSGRVRSYTYDDLGRAAADVLMNAAGEQIAKVTYGYDLDDRLTGKNTAGTAGAGTNTYAYDDAGRLTSWTSAAGTVQYGWDDSGNRIRAGTKSATYDQRNRLLSDSDYTYAYTPRGTMASRTSSGLVEKYSFDAFDRLTGAEDQTYAYDGLNRLVQRNGTAFTYAGFEQDPVSDGVESYARGADGELLAVGQGDQKSFALSDAHEDVVGTFAAGDDLTALSSSTAYDPYGQQIATSGQTTAVGFQGDWTDRRTGQVNMGARWYEPGTGGFTSRDSANYSQGSSILANKYTYGAGNPMANNDPTGNWPSCSWCRKTWNSVTSGVAKAWNGFTSGAERAWNGFTSWVSRAWNGATGAARRLYRQSTAALSAALRYGVDTVKRAWSGFKSGVRAGTNSVRTAYHKYVAPRVKSAKNWAAERAAEARRVAVQVRDKAKAAISYVAKKTPIGKLAKAALPVIAGLGKLAFTAVTQPAKLTQAYHAVVQDTQAAAKKLYDQAMAAGGAVLDGLQKAGDWVVDHKAEIIGGIVGAVVGVGCGALIGVTGVGLVACGALAGMAGSLVSDLVGGGKGWQEMAGNAFKNGILGAVLGPLSAVGGAAVVGGARGLAQGGLNAVLGGGREGARGAVQSMGGRQVGGLAGRLADRRAAASAAGRNNADELTECNSFVPGVAVLMADGSSKRIEDVRVGDVVVATDPTTGKTQKRAVTHLIVGHGEKKLVEITVETSDGAAGAITATDGHPFWVADLGQWVDAGGLKPGSLLQTGAGTYVKVSAVRRWTAQGQVAHNLTVDGLHTYYVLAGNTPVLVHNCGGDVPAPSMAANPLGPHRPAGVGDGWTARTADNGKGSVWQAPGATGNADMVRTMNPTPMYPDGYVRFYNKHGQPIGLNGKPGSKAETHIPMNPDSTYPLPAGW